MIGSPAGRKFFTKGDPCTIRVWIDAEIEYVELAGVITQESPIKARVTDPDPIWFGCEFGGREIRKAKP